MSGLRSRQRKQKKKEVNSVQNCSAQWEKKKQEEQKLKPTKKVSGERRRRGGEGTSQSAPLPGERRPSTGGELFYLVPASRAVLADTKHIHLTTNSFQVTRELPPLPSSLPGWGRVRRCPIRPTIRHNTNTMKGWQEQSLRRVRGRERDSERQ